MGKIRDDVPAVRFQRPAALAESKFLVVSTPAAVSVAAINALAGAVERARHLMQADGYYAKVVLTGGDAARILMALEGQPAHRTHLVLHGLARLLENRR